MIYVYMYNEYLTKCVTIYFGEAENTLYMLK